MTDKYRPDRWTLDQVQNLRILTRLGWSNYVIACSLERLKEDIDKALWIILGRTDEQALYALNMRYAY
jgi:hypothetical protein